MSLFTNIAKVQAEMGDLPRDKHVNTGKYQYSYVSEDAITKAIRDKLCALGVAVLISWEHVEQDGNLTTVRGNITFADEDDKFMVGIMGYGSDASDKGLNKAMTSAVRMGLCKCVLQAGDDDGEHEANQRQPAKQAKKPDTGERPLHMKRWDEAVKQTGSEDAVKKIIGTRTDVKILEQDAAWDRLQERIKELTK